MKLLPGSTQLAHGRRLLGWAAALSVLSLATGLHAKPKEVPLTNSIIAVPPVLLPQVRIDKADVSAWPKVRILASVLDGRGAPVELKGLVRVDVLDGTKKATVASKQNPALVRFEKGVALDGRKDAKLQPRAESGIGLGAVIVAQGYGSGIEPIVEQRLKEAVAAAFKPLGKGDRVNLLYYFDEIYQATSLRNFDSNLVSIENADVRKKCADARREARSGGPITLGAVASKETPPLPPGTDLCGLQPDPSKVAELAKSWRSRGAFPRLFALGPPFWDLGRYCATPGGSLAGFGAFNKTEYEANKQVREDAANKGEYVDFQVSAVDAALSMLVRDGRPGEHLAIVLLSDGRDGWVWDLQTCGEHPPKPCDIYDATAGVNTDRLAKMSEKQQMGERFRLSIELRKCVDKAQVLTARVALMQKEFRDKAQQWIGLARAANIRIYAIGLRRPGVVTNPFDLERLRLLADKTGGTYREVADGQPAVSVVAKTMAEVTGQLTIDFTHQTPDDVEEAGPNLALRLAVTLDSKLEHKENTGTQLASEVVLAPLPKSLSLWQQLKDVGWWLLVKIQTLMGYDAYVILGWVLSVLALLVSLLIIWKLLKKLFKKQPKTA